jgi:hypothetical protein
MKIFADNAFSFEVGRMTFVWVHYIFTVGMIFIGITSSIPCRESGKIISTTVLIYIAFAEALLCIGYCICEGIVLLDTCEDFRSVLDTSKGEYLLNYRAGLEYYMPPLTQWSKANLTELYVKETNESCKNLIEFMWYNCAVHVFAKMSERRLCVYGFDQLMIVIGAIVGLTMGSLMIVVMYNQMKQLIAKKLLEKEKKKKGFDKLGSISGIYSYIS